MLKSKSTTNIRTQTETTWNSLHKHSRTEARTVESQKQEPCRQHSTMSLMEISKSIPQNLNYSERNKILPKNDTQKFGNSPKRYPKIREQPPKKYPK